MTMRYSPSENGFYPETIDYPNLPEDVFIISDELYQKLMDGQSEGKVITPDGKNDPCLTEPVIDYISIAINEKASLRSAADMAIAPLQDSVELDMATEEENEKLKEWRIYRVLLSRIDTNQAPDITWPDVPGEIPKK